eukprot:TRINITY_DN83078_c0_g1_i1.p2 TRINITY_DN83078_c0_g1~~TRINITY_DN83078_c0_g1_i1.p2  ORF type:complete len:177 (-),score=65.41 TRINITY_DN83078_c0_g1_i1:82-612(-)
MAPAAKADSGKMQPKKSMKGENIPFVEIGSLKEVFPLFADKGSKLLKLEDVPYLLRALGLTVYGEEEAKIKAEVEKIDGLGKPITYKTLSDWWEENHKEYVRSYDDAYNALGRLCFEEIIGRKPDIVVYNHLRNLVSRVGDKIEAEEVDKILKGEHGLKADECNLEDFLKCLQSQS